MRRGPRSDPAEPAETAVLPGPEGFCDERVPGFRVHRGCFESCGTRSPGRLDTFISAGDRRTYARVAGGGSDTG